MCKYTSVFCIVDDFCKIYEEWERHRLIGGAKKRERRGKLSLSEQLSIAIFYHMSPFKDFKRFYRYGVEGEHRRKFKELPCYARFIQLTPRLFLPLCLMLHYLSGRRTGVYIADSTHLSVCKNMRISRHKTFNGLAERGRTTVGWFFGFKLHLIINDKAEIIAIKITPGNTDDRAFIDQMTQELEGKLFADKGYISSSLFKKLYSRGLRLITGIKKNMKNYLIPWLDKLMLRKRFIIETVFQQLKESANFHLNKHRSPINAFVSLLSALAAYQINPNKPKLSPIYP